MQHWTEQFSKSLARFIVRKVSEVMGLWYKLNQYCVISIEILLKCRFLLEFSWFLKNYKRLIKALLKIELFCIDLNIVFCKDLKIFCKITLGIGILTSVVRVSVRFPVNTCCTTKDKHGSWKPLSLYMWPMTVIVEGV